MTARKRLSKKKLAKAGNADLHTSRSADEATVLRMHEAIRPVQAAVGLGRQQQEALEAAKKTVEKQFEGAASQGKIIQSAVNDAKTAASVIEKANAALNVAKQFYNDQTTWVEANNKLYGIGGILTQLLPTPADRAEFIKTKQSAEIQSILENLPEPKSKLGKPRVDVNGKILVRVPRSVHAALIAEAEAEGVSLNQLIVSKLSLQLRAAV